MVIAVLGQHWCFHPPLTADRAVKKLVDPVPMPLSASGEEPLELPQASAEVLEVSADMSTVGTDEAPTPALPEPLALAGGLKIERLPDGGLRVDAPPELAVPLAALLESLATELRATSGVG